MVSSDHPLETQLGLNLAETSTNAAPYKLVASKKHHFDGSTQCRTLITGAKLCAVLENDFYLNLGEGLQVEIFRYPSS